ncbi:MAG: hypothetical protein PHD43_22195, partial [Methylococcales bacterium]|nr:hypothetical protein [Methylococcales bacterium]
MANHALSITEIGKQNISIYPDFSDTCDISAFASMKQKIKPRLYLVGKATTEISTNLTSTTSTLDDFTSIDSLDIDEIKGYKTTTNQEPDYSDITNRNRVALLARKYAQKGFSKEDEARLAWIRTRGAWPDSRGCSRASAMRKKRASARVKKRMIRMPSCV